MSTSTLGQDMLVEQFGVNQKLGDRPAAELRRINAQGEGQLPCLRRRREETSALQEPKRVSIHAASLSQFGRTQAEGTAARRNK